MERTNNVNSCKNNLAYFMLKNRGKLFAGTVPANKKLFAGTVPANKKLFAGTLDFVI